MLPPPVARAKKCLSLSHVFSLQYEDGATAKLDPHLDRNWKHPPRKANLSNAGAVSRAVPAPAPGYGEPTSPINKPIAPKGFRKSPMAGHSRAIRTASGQSTPKRCISLGLSLGPKA